MDEALFHHHAEMETRHWWFLARRRIVRRILPHFVPTGSEPRIVDVGCGTGGVIGALEGSRLGLDPSPTAIEVARERYPGCEFRVEEAAAAADREGGAADVVLLMDVLEHVEDDAGLLADATRLLKSGGHLLATVPADPRLWSEHDVAHGHHRRYTLSDFAGLLSGAPLTIRAISYFQSRLYPLVRVVRAVGRRLGGGGGRQGTDLWMPPSPLNRLLEEVFAGEGKRIEAMVRGDDVPEYMRGSSVIAVCRKPSPGDGART